MKKLSLSELRVKSKSGRWKTRKRPKRRNLFSEFSSPKFLILSIRPKSKSRKRKSQKKISQGFQRFRDFRVFDLVPLKQVFYGTPLVNASERINGKHKCHDL